MGFDPRQRSAMFASGPATGPALAVAQAFATPEDALLPGLALLGRFDPANPFVAGQRRNVFPGLQRFRISLQRAFQILGKIMDDAAGSVLLVRPHQR